MLPLKTTRSRSIITSNKNKYKATNNNLRHDTLIKMPCYYDLWSYSITNTENLVRLASFPLTS